MSWEDLGSKEIAKTRKDFHCYACNELVPAGSKAYKSVGVFDGEFQATKYCIRCGNAMLRLSMEYPGEDFCMSSIVEERDEYEARELKEIRAIHRMLKCEDNEDWSLTESQAETLANRILGEKNKE